MRTEKEIEEERQRFVNKIDDASHIELLAFYSLAISMCEWVLGRLQIPPSIIDDTSLFLTEKVKQNKITTKQAGEFMTEMIDKRNRRRDA